MSVIYYIVSGGGMEILQFLLNLLNGNSNLGVLAPIINLLKENSFDIKKTLNSLSPDTLAPIIKEFMSAQNNIRPTETVGRSEGLTPIANVADKDIVYTLNKYLS